MRRILTFLLLVALCLGTTATLLVAPVSGPGAAVAATGEYSRTFSYNYLKSMTETHGHYGLQNSGTTYFEQDWKGVDLQYLLETEVGLAAGTTGVKVQAYDFASGTSMTLDQCNGNSSDKGLKTLLAYSKGTAGTTNPNAPDGTGPWPLGTYTAADTLLDPNLGSGEGEGPFRTIMPQTTSGPSVGNTTYTTPAGSGTVNSNKSTKWVCAIEVLPLPAGMSALTLTELQTLYGNQQIVVYGNINPYAISGLSRTSGYASISTVTVNGYGFGSVQGTSTVSFGATSATVTSWEAQSITCTVPNLAAGSYPVTVTTAEGASNAIDFTVFPTCILAEDHLKSVDLRTTGHYTSQSTGATYFEQDWYGADLWYLLEEEVRIAIGTTGIKTQASDNWNVDMTLAQVQGNGNPRGLKTILGYEYGTKATNPNNLEGNMDGTGTFPSMAPVTPDTFETTNGPFRVVMPQSNEGPGSTNDNYSPVGDGDANSFAWNKKLRAVEILPLPAGMTELTTTELAAIPANQVIFYGNISSFTITASAGTGGTIAPAGDVPVLEGADQTFTIAPDEHYSIADVLVDGSSVGAVTSYEFTDVAANHTIAASFAIDTFEVAASVSGGGGTVDPASQTVDYGSEATVVINPEAGYYVASITDNEASVAIAIPYVIGDVAADHEVVVTFAEYSFYFAEGYTGTDTFTEYLCLMNPGDAAVNAHVTYMFADGTTQAQDVPVGATSRTTVNVNGVVGADKDVSVKITSDGFIVAERPMYFNYNGAWTGGHDVIGITSPRTSFYFAEGYTGAGTFDEYLCLMNPNGAGMMATITFMFADGTTQEQEVEIGATSRITVNVNSVVGADKEVSVKIISDDPFVAERPMYFNYNGAWTGGHDVIGITSPRTSFYFAEGYTGAGTFDEYLCLMNPGDAATKAYITFMFADGTTQEQEVAIGATSRTTVKVNDQVGADKDVSVKITSDDPIVAERSMYFNYSGAWTGGHDVVGAVSPMPEFYFAEGYTGTGTFDEYLCLMNPNAASTKAYITYMFADGTTQEQTVDIGATSRITVNVNSVVGADKDVSVMLRADEYIVAERPMYFNYNGAWTGGHDVVGYTP